MELLIAMMLINNISANIQSDCEATYDKPSQVSQCYARRKYCIDNALLDKSLQGEAFSEKVRGCYND